MDNLYHCVCILIMVPPFQPLSSLLEKILIFTDLFTFFSRLDGGRNKRDRIFSFLPEQQGLWDLDIKPSSVGQLPRLHTSSHSTTRERGKKRSSSLLRCNREGRAQPPSPMNRREWEHSCSLQAVDRTAASKGIFLVQDETFYLCILKNTYDFLQSKWLSLKPQFSTITKMLFTKVFAFSHQPSSKVLLLSISREQRWAYSGLSSSSETEKGDDDFYQGSHSKHVEQLRRDGAMFTTICRATDSPIGNSAHNQLINELRY